METTPIGIGKRKVISSSTLEKLKKKKKKKRKGKRSSASSASAGGSPDSTGDNSPQKSKSACACSPGTTSNQAVSEFGSDDTLNTAVNESLRWVAYSPSLNAQLGTISISGRFPASGKTGEEEEERIAIYKMNRRKRYIAAQQALFDKYPDVGIYASSSSASSNGKKSDDAGGVGRIASNAGSEKNNAQFVMMAGTKHVKSCPPTSANSSIIQFTHIPILPNTSVLNSSKDVTSYASNYKLAVPNTDLTMGNLTNITTQA